MCVCSVMSSSIRQTVAHPAPLSMKFSRQDTEADYHFLLQGIFPTQGPNCAFYISCIGRQILYHWTTWEAPQMYCSRH